MCYCCCTINNVLANIPFISSCLYFMYLILYSWMWIPEISNLIKYLNMFKCSGGVLFSIARRNQIKDLRIISESPA